jgi:uncharacterized protein (TIGR02594 family)
MSIVALVARGPLRLGAKGPAVAELQEALRRFGAELVADSEFGRITRLAVERFQASHRIAADGEVGPITAGYLDAIRDDPPAVDPLPSALNLVPWLSYMRALTGTKEIPGARSNPLILSWVKSLGARYPRLRPNIDWYRDDDTPWCGLAIAEVVGECDPGFEPPAAPLGAINWAPWGVQLEGPALGAVMVFRRPGGNHVALYEGEDATHFHIRGGNQSNMINVTRKAKNQLVRGGIRWPKGYPLPEIKAVKKAAAGAVSINEA